MEYLRKYKYLFLALASIAVIFLAINLLKGRNKGDGPIMWLKKDPVPLNKLITNSMSDHPQTQKFDAAIRRFMRYWDIKGGSFALMRNDSLIYAKGYGYANVQDSTECDVKHIFRVASVSKLITAVAIMRLNETGALSVNDQVFGEEGILNDTLFQHFRSKHIKKITTTISVIITTDGFINQFSLNKLQKLNIKVELEQTIRKMIIDQMKYFLYDIHQEVVDLGSIETKYSNTF